MRKAILFVQSLGRVDDSKIQVGIVEHDQLIFATQLQRYLLQITSGSFPLFATGRSGTRELDHPDIGITGHGCTSSAIARKNLQHAGQQASQFKQACDHETAAYCGTRIWLEYHGVA